MKLPTELVPTLVDLERLVSSQEQGDYIYMYPPRQAYRPADPATLASHVDNSLRRTRGQPVNLYAHFPFCKQICNFCNLYAVPTRGDEVFDTYITSLFEDFRGWESRLQGRPVSTVYLGGGTPSLMSPAHVEKVLVQLSNSFGFSIESIDEVAMEVAPDTVSKAKLHDFHAAGVRRVNLGLQAASTRELASIGRRSTFEEAQKAIEAAVEVGFDNVCVDLIYGLPGQSCQDWESSLRKVIEMMPETVCPYPWTWRPMTGFRRREPDLGADYYLRYEMASEMLQGAGYLQETHVRYVQPGRGGYIQKENHWAGQDVVGFGAGARGYLEGVDYRNGYSINPRKRALNEYLRKAAGAARMDAGLVLSTDERMRRRIVLGLFDLDLIAFERDFGEPVHRRFGDLLAGLADMGLIAFDELRASLTVEGRKFRDLVALIFFSEDVYQGVAGYDYRS